jgi:nuclear transport factor 2 (NTF2) superfamily protein
MTRLLVSLYGNENWAFNDDGLMASRFASINDLPIVETDRKSLVTGRRLMITRIERTGPLVC